MIMEHVTADYRTCSCDKFNKNVSNLVWLNVIQAAITGGGENIYMGVKLVDMFEHCPYCGKRLARKIKKEEK